MTECQEQCCPHKSGQMYTEFQQERIDDLRNRAKVLYNGRDVVVGNFKATRIQWREGKNPTACLPDIEYVLCQVEIAVNKAEKEMQKQIDAIINESYALANELGEDENDFLKLICAG